MQPNATPAPPPPFQPWLLLACIAALAACSAPVEHRPEWQEVSAAPAPPDAPDAPTLPTSLGDPFAIVADTESMPSLANASAGPSTDVRHAWALLRSDACEVELSSLYVAFQRVDADTPGWLSTTGPVRGVVLAASPHRVVVRCETIVQVQRERDAGAHPATVELEVEQSGADVWLRIRLTTSPVDAQDSLRLVFDVRGAFEDDPAAIPARRLACPLY